MDRASLESFLQTAKTRKAATSLIFLLRTTARGARADGSFELQRARMDKEIAQEFRNVLSGHLERLATTADLDFVSFDPHSVSDGNRLEVEPVDRVPPLAHLVQQMETPASIPFAKLNDGFFKSLWAYAVVLHVADGPLAYFRKFQPSKVIRGGGLKALVQKGTLTRIEDPVFNFDEQADALVLGTDVLILQKTLFEQMFELVRTLYAPLASQAVQKIAALGLIDDMQAFEQVCQKDERKQKKLADIFQNEPFAQITFEKLSQVKEEWSVDVDLDPVARKILFDPAKAWNILKLIDDDYLRSPMTRERYEVQSKRKVQRRPGTAPRRRRRSSGV
jgi:hypothetical protein